MTNDISFSTLDLAQPIQRALKEKNYTQPSPIQAQAIPHLLEGKDLIGCAQTGTGKTAAFALPILHRLAAQPKARTRGTPRALILTPTRELAAQIGANFAAYGKHLELDHTVIFGGVGQNPQVRALNDGVEILVATPGRLLDLQKQGHVHLEAIEVFVLDEADRMLDMGFAPDVKRIIARLPAQRQSLLFSATMPAPILDIARQLLRNPVKVEVTPASSTVERIAQHVCHLDKRDKNKLLVHSIREQGSKGLVLVFSRTKHGANKLVKHLEVNGIRSAAIHGNKSQGAREKALEQFRAGNVRVLIATDIAARGIDVKGITLVINYDIPNEPESYVHRIGRTARAGAEGIAIAFCEPGERGFLNSIEKLIRMKIPVIQDHPYAIHVNGSSSRNPSAPSRQGNRSKGRPANGPARFGRDQRSGQAPSGRSASRQRRNRNSPSGESSARRSDTATLPAKATPARKSLWRRFGF